MSYVIGIDLGTSAVKALLVDRDGHVVRQASKPYPLIHPSSGYAEQDPEDWVNQSMVALQELLAEVDASMVEGISFSGQMHGLVLLDRQRRVLRNAILWNDTRTSEECREIERKLGSRLLDIAKNRALEGFTLPKMLWVQKHEPDVYARAEVFMLPKDYVRYRFTGEIYTEYSDAAGTLLLDVAGKRWSEEICRTFGIDPAMCPPLIESGDPAGDLLPEIAARTGLSPKVKIFAGGADNACGAVGSGILSPGETLCSIGTSGVVLSYEQDGTRAFGGKLHLFNHAQTDGFYSMGVTLAAGHSLNWFKEVYAADMPFDSLIAGAGEVPAGAGGLLFSPYLAGERTPHADAAIRGSFIGIDSAHRLPHFARAVMEGITFSLNESVEIMRETGVSVDAVVAIGGGAKKDLWLQMMADIFRAQVVKLDHEQGPGMGAAMIAAAGCGWFDTLEQCARRFVKKAKSFDPVQESSEVYAELFALYRQVYPQTRGLSQSLAAYRE